MTLDASTGTFQAHRPLLLNIAYRMLGSYAEAEDVVQEAWLRWHAQDQEIQTPKPWLTRTVTRLCLDSLKSARSKRETYVGSWLPEPVPTDKPSPFGDAVELADSLSLALLAVLERLSPMERAAFLLREIFDYSYKQLADILDVSEENCRQIAHRARARVRSERPKFKVDPQEREDLLQRFGQAAASGELENLVALFHEGITLWSDGGGKVKATLRPVYGPQKVARFFRGIKDKIPTDLSIQIRQINGEAALVYMLGQEPFSVIALDVEDGLIRGVLMVRNPEKLKQIKAS